MKKTFIVEIEYNELPENTKKNADVLYAESLEAYIEDMMYGYQETRSIIGNYEVTVLESTPLKLEVKNDFKFDLKTVYAAQYTYYKEGYSIWVSDKRVFDTDLEIKVNEFDILKFVEHNDKYDCDIFELIVEKNR
jgi:hypothetical protein